MSGPLGPCRGAVGVRGEETSPSCVCVSSFISGLSYELLLKGRGESWSSVQPPSFWDKPAFSLASQGFLRAAPRGITLISTQSLSHGCWA